MLRGQIVSYLKERKMISKGCMYHLILVKDSGSKTPNLESIPVVGEILDVFPKDLPGVSPKRKIDFRIGLLLDT